MTPPPSARVRAFLRRARASYWFVPTVTSLACAALAVAVTAADRAALGHGVLAGLPFGGRAASLTTVLASAMLTTAGVVFSITVAAVANATSHYGPRILTYFLADRGNQATLAVLVGAFVYGLGVLFLLEGGASYPLVWTSAATLTLGLVATGFLIYFLNHLPTALHASHLVARLGRQLVAYVASPYPSVGEGGPEAGPPPDGARPVTARASGYVAGVDEAGLFRWACEQGATVWMAVRPGDFVLEGDVVLRVEGGGAGGELGAMVTVEAERAAAQDAMFLVDELAEIAVRALSPSLNDPFTAMNTMDWTAAGWAAVLKSRALSASRYDASGALRLASPPVGFEQYVERYVAQVRPYAVADRNARLRLVRTIARVAPAVEGRPAERAALREALAGIEAAGRRLVRPEEEAKWAGRLEEARAALAGADAGP